LPVLAGTEHVPASGVWPGLSVTVRALKIALIR
jgi:hypothetical protein